VAWDLPAELADRVRAGAAAHGLSVERYMVKSKIVCKRSGLTATPGQAANRSRTFLPVAWRTRMYASNCLRSMSVNFTLSHR